MLLLPNINTVFSYLKMKVAYNREKKNSILKTPPSWITVGVTNACRNSCGFCAYHSKDAQDSSNVYNIPYMMDLEYFKKIIDMAKKSAVPRVHICSTGEPFMNKNILNMIDYCIKVYGKTSFQTNFDHILFDKHQYLDEIIKRKDNINYITTDILSGCPQQHNDIKIGSSYEFVMNCIERISRETNIPVNICWVLTQNNYTTLMQWIDEAKTRKLRNITLLIQNLFSYDFNDLTSSEAVYSIDDTELTNYLQKVRMYGIKNGIPVSIPYPAGSKKNQCDVFWRKVQIWPVKGNDPARYQENMIPMACRAVVKGKLNSLGYLFDYDNIMDFWNNEKLVTIRKNLLKGIYPDDECKYCYCCEHFLENKDSSC